MDKCGLTLRNLGLFFIAGVPWRRPGSGVSEGILTSIVNLRAKAAGRKEHVHQATHSSLLRAPWEGIVEHRAFSPYFNNEALGTRPMLTSVRNISRTVRLRGPHPPPTTRAAAAPGMLQSGPTLLTSSPPRSAAEAAVTCANLAHRKTRCHTGSLRALKLLKNWPTNIARTISERLPSITGQCRWTSTNLANPMGAQTQTCSKVAPTLAHSRTQTWASV